jgi:hypothetical protein
MHLVSRHRSDCVVLASFEGGTNAAFPLPTPAPALPEFHPLMPIAFERLLPDSAKADQLVRSNDGGIPIRKTPEKWS